MDNIRECFAPTCSAISNVLIFCGMTCIDVYKVTCGTKTRFLNGFVTDNDDAEDNLTLTLTALTPGSIKGDTMQTFIHFGAGAFASSFPAFLTRPGTTTGGMSALAAVSSISNAAVFYRLDLQCFDTDGFPTPTTTTVVQDQ